MASTLVSGGVRTGWPSEGPTEAQGAYTGRGRALGAVPAPTSGIPQMQAAASPIQDVGDVPGVVAAATTYLETSPANHHSQAIDKAHRIVGFNDLRLLLQPTHPYFEDKQAHIKEFAFYKHTETSEHWLCYPRVKAQHPNNPYRKRQLSSSHTARTISKLVALIRRFDLDSFVITGLILTMPKQLSLYFAQQPKGAQIAWRLFNRFWHHHFRSIGDNSSGQSAYVNLHTWKTEDPTQPHFHFHCLIPNYRVVQYRAPNSGKLSTACFVRRMWHKQPYSDEELDLIKELWAKVLYAFARRHKIRTPLLKSGHAVNVYVDYVSWDDPHARPKLMNKFNYQNRHWTLDYARYSNANPECPPPPPYLETYQNRARVFGWWKKLASLIGPMDPSKEQRPSPVTGEQMFYQGSISIAGLLLPERGELGYLDFSKGMPCYGILSHDDLHWLKGVCFPTISPQHHMVLDIPP